VAKQLEDLGLSSRIGLSGWQVLEQVVELPRRIPCFARLLIEPENLSRTNNKVRVNVFLELEPILVHDGKKPIIAYPWQRRFKPKTIARLAIGLIAVILKRGQDMQSASGEEESKTLEQAIKQVALRLTDAFFR
jgi:hypothetical protein